MTQSAKLNIHDPYAYLKDILTRLPTHPNSRINELLLHNWKPEHTQVAEPTGDQDAATLAVPDHAAA